MYVCMYAFYCELKTPENSYVLAITFVF